MNTIRSLSVLLALACSVAAPSARADAEVRFHPADHVWTHELEAARGLASVLVPSQEIPNATTSPASATVRSATPRQARPSFPA